MIFRTITTFCMAALPLLASAQGINFDDLRRPGTPLIRSYTIDGAGTEGSRLITQFGDVDMRRVQEAAARRSTYATSSGGGASSSSGSNSSSKNTSGLPPSKNSASAQGVERISDNGILSGVPSSRVQCRSGGSHIVYYKNGTWYHGVWMGMGSKYDSWSVAQLAEHLCK